MVNGMSKYDDDITILGADLAVGERSSHLLCPKCNGGNSRELSLLIWSDPDCLTYKCYRVACGLYGKTGVSGYRKVAVKKHKPKTSVRDVRPEPLPEDVIDWLVDEFPWLTQDILYLNGVQWDDIRERIVYPITSLTGTEEGLLLRKYPELVLDETNLRGMKAKTFWRDMPEGYKLTALMPPRNAVRTDSVVLVEDYPSAMRLNLDVPTVALSGTSIQDASLMDIVKAGKRHVVMVLDADAVAKAAKLTHNYSPFFHSMSFIPLGVDDPDPKDMDDHDYHSLLTEIQERLPNGSTDTSVLSRQSPSIRRGGKVRRNR